MATWQGYLQDHRGRFLDEMMAFLRIASVSSLPSHAQDVQAAGEWVATRMRAAGIEDVRVLATGGHPVVYGSWLHAPDKPTILIYGHFDVQPVDPISEWTHPPFEPVVAKGRVYARGASDDKGNMLIPILAVEALLQAEGKLPVNVKFLFEGQEEIGSPQMPQFMAAHADLFSCDLVISADGGQWGEEQPELNIGTRGLAAVQIDVHGANSDLHSGVHGGAAPNPIRALAQLLASMHTSDGAISVEGFYDAVLPLSSEDRERIAAIPFDEEEYQAGLGVEALPGEPGYSVLERRWARPTLEFNGIWGGFQGEGAKTVIAREAHAKITCRLVANQEPAHIVALITEHVQKHCPAGVTASVVPLPGSARPYLMPVDHPGITTAHRVLEQVYGKTPFYTRSGGSIPVCELFQQHLGAYTVMFAFALEDERFHAPDEFFRLSSWTRGQEAYGLLLHELGK